MKAHYFVGGQPLNAPCLKVHGELMQIEGEEFYRIANHEQMRPFFMSVVSDADHWMFISSNGGLTAGRCNPDLALFPYYTDDKIHDSAETTGSKTIMIVRKQGRAHLWEPFAERYRGLYRTRRSLYKNITGNKIIFEETNEDLALTFRCGWFNSERFGFVRKAWLVNHDSRLAGISILDGIQNLMPCGISSQFQLEKSTLVDAYKKNELLPQSGLGLFMLSAIPIDRPEPAESLKATTVWSLGLKRQVTLLSAVQIDRFRQGMLLREEQEVRAERGAYFVQSDFDLQGGETIEWMVAADVNRGPSDVVELDQLLGSPKRLKKMVEVDIARGTRELRRIIGSTDGLQKSGNKLGDARHSNNILFNVMRGGLFVDGYKVDVRDLRDYVERANRNVFVRQGAFFRSLKSGISYGQMLAMTREVGDAQLERICREYLPLAFSRRHGDPSRPWNRFSIPSRKADGSRALWYEGNWRDIFQNWEALAVSFPGFVGGMICRFVNASTADGYNPYRITRDGIDWEVVEPNDPWSFIGYWGDHQIVYLLKLLEVFERHDPSALRGMLDRDIFAYANVPYRIKPYRSLLKDPKDTVVFDQELEELVHERVRTTGSDGKLMWDDKGNVRLVNLAEKLLVSLLAKMSNFVPGAGIWLNTQRPEWNDANNALVGNGASMVTLYYLRRMLTFCVQVFQSAEMTRVRLSEEVTVHLQDVSEILRDQIGKPFNDSDRKRLLDKLGEVGSRYRERIYAKGFAGRRRSIQTKEIISFFSSAREVVDQTIRGNCRSDGLYHSYNLIKPEERKISVRHLYEMLEGQVAVLCSGVFSAEESLVLLRKLRQSAMYRADQHSYLLYPDRRLPIFVEKNVIPAKQIRRSALLVKLLADGNRVLVECDVAGRVHFNGVVKNANDVRQILERLASTGYERLVKKETAKVLDVFEGMFDHQSFTGRSGTFFGYEGLGSIYWHMVSKLLLAAQESYFRAVETGASEAVIKGLADCYYDIRAGIGDCKTPENYGAFPMDPYSHTPGHTGARQPGLTGQVKEDILCRFGELGVIVKAGLIHFEPWLLRREEFLEKRGTFRFVDLSGEERSLRLEKGELAFTYCQTPVVYRLGHGEALSVKYKDGSQRRLESLSLDIADSQEVFERSGRIERIDVVLNLRPVGFLI